LLRGLAKVGPARLEFAIPQLLGSPCEPAFEGY
jgi:hypothetical protein